MTATHHPTEATLAEFLTGSLDEGRRIVVSAHFEMCASCRGLSRALETAAGDYLEALPPTSLADTALKEAIARLDTRHRQPPRKPAATSSGLPVSLAALAPYELGDWRWIGPGIYQRHVTLLEGGRSRVFLLKAAPGTRLPQHTHEGTELTVILKGAFRHQGGRFAAGDCDDADDSVEHSPVVEEGEECICLVAMEGNIRLRGFIGRLLQPFVRM